MSEYRCCDRDVAHGMKPIGLVLYSQDDRASPVTLRRVSLEDIPDNEELWCGCFLFHLLCPMVFTPTITQSPSINVVCE